MSDDLKSSSLCNGVVASVLARQKPQPPKDTPREYHNLTAGWIMNEVSGTQSNLSTVVFNAELSPGVQETGSQWRDYWELVEKRADFVTPLVAFFNSSKWR